MFEGLLQPMHLLVILAAGCSFSGQGKGMGEGIRGFKDALDNAQKPNSLDEVQHGRQRDPGPGDQA